MKDIKKAWVTGNEEYPPIIKYRENHQFEKPKEPKKEESEEEEVSDDD